MKKTETMRNQHGRRTPGAACSQSTRVPFLQPAQRRIRTLQTSDETWPSLLDLHVLTVSGGQPGLHAEFTKPCEKQQQSPLHLAAGVVVVVVVVVVGFRATITVLGATTLCVDSPRTKSPPSHQSHFSESHDAIKRHVPPLPPHW
jgi:hypothetical protein